MARKTFIQFTCTAAGSPLDVRAPQPLLLHAMDRRTFLQGAALSAAAAALPPLSHAEQQDLSAISARIAQQHDQSVKRLQDWIRQPSIAAENRGMAEGCQL